MLAIEVMQSKLINLSEIVNNDVTFRFHFLHNSPFHEKTYNCENSRRKSLLLTMEQFFFKI